MVTICGLAQGWHQSLRLQLELQRLPGQLLRGVHAQDACGSSRKSVAAMETPSWWFSPPMTVLRSCLAEEHDGGETGGGAALCVMTKNFGRPVAVLACSPSLCLAPPQPAAKERHRMVLWPFPARPSKQRRKARLTVKIDSACILTRCVLLPRGRESVRRPSLNACHPRARRRGPGRQRPRAASREATTSTSVLRP